MSLWKLVSLVSCHVSKYGHMVAVVINNWNWDIDSKFLFNSL